jgi:hypothetical protein
MPNALIGVRPSLRKEVPGDGPVVRVVALAIAVWTDVAVGWSGASPAIWLLGIGLVTTGHGFSWRFRDWSSPMRALAVGTAVVVVLLLMRGSIFAVASGSMLPAAHLMVIFQGVAAFELRSRAGIYASLAMSGLIFYFVSLQALQMGFSVFVIGLAVLVLAFLAVTFMWDRVKDADVEWFKSDFASAGLWSAVAVLVLVAAIGGFLIMPTNIQAGTAEPDASVLPLRGDESLDSLGAPNQPDGQSNSEVGNQTDIQSNPFEEAFGSNAASDDPAGVSGAEALPDSGDGQPGDELIDPNLDTPGDAGPDPFGDTGTGGVGESVGPSTDASSDQGSGSGSSFSTPGTGIQSLPLGGDDTTVMNVRTSVLSYWRGAAYDRFEDGRWWFDPSYHYNRLEVTRDRNSFRGSQGWLYSQTFFHRGSLPNGEVFTGYDVSGTSQASIDPRNAGDQDIVVYKALSNFPDFAPTSLDGARAITLSTRYEALPDDLTWLKEVATDLVAGSVTDFQRAGKITAFLKDNYRFDREAPDQLTINWPLLSFLRTSEPATAMEFATAAVMLYRAAGVPARLVTGYLPGTFDHLSGTYIVSESDRHVWPEVFLSGDSRFAKWVPFDPTPRPELAAFSVGGTAGDPPMQKLFETSYGDEIIDGITDSPQLLASAVASSFKNALGPALAATSAVLSLAALAWVIWKLHLPDLRRRRERSYTRLGGDARAEMMDLYRKAERLIAGNGVGPRLAWQTAGDYAAAARTEHERAGAEIDWFRRSAESASYDPAPFDEGLVGQGIVRLRRLSAALKGVTGPDPNLDLDESLAAIEGELLSHRRLRLGLGAYAGPEGWKALYGSDDPSENPRH